jgi:hypothetical protein
MFIEEGSLQLFGIAAIDAPILKDQNSKERERVESFFSLLNGMNSHKV